MSNASTERVDPDLIRSIPATVHITDPELRRILDALAENVRYIRGRQEDIEDSIVLTQDPIPGTNAMLTDEDMLTPNEGGIIIGAQGIQGPRGYPGQPGAQGLPGEGGTGTITIETAGPNHSLYIGERVPGTHQFRSLSATSGVAATNAEFNVQFTLDLSTLEEDLSVTIADDLVAYYDHDAAVTRKVTFANFLPRDVKASASDTVPGYLDGKISAGAALKATILSAGADEDLLLDVDITELSAIGTSVDPANDYMLIWDADGAGEKHTKVLVASIDTYKLKINGNDTTPEFLDGKLIAGTGVDLAVTGDDPGDATMTLTLDFSEYTEDATPDYSADWLASYDVTGDGAMKKISLYCTTKVAVSSNDTTPNYLSSKLLKGNGITITTTDTGDETMTLSLAVTVGTGLVFSDAATRNLTLDFSAFTEDETPDVTLDFFVTYDASATTQKKVDLRWLTRVSVSADDTTPGYLIDKLAEGNGIDITFADGGDETATITLDIGEGNGIDIAGGTTPSISVDLTAGNGITISVADSPSIAVALSAGAGLSYSAGATCSFAVDIASLTADATPDAAADYVMTLDATDGSYKKVLIEDLGDGVGTDELVGTSATDTTPGYLSAKLVTTAGQGLTLTESGVPGPGLYTVDIDFTLVTADASPDPAADYVLTYDASAAAGSHTKKVLLEDLPALDGTLKVSATDSTLGYLNGKLVAGNGITLTKIGADAAPQTLSVIANIGVGSGLDITNAAQKVISLDIDELTADATPDGSADYVLSYDADAAAHKKVLMDNLPVVQSAANREPAGVTHVDIYDTLSSNVLYFKPLTAGGAGIAITSGANAVNINLHAETGDGIIIAQGVLDPDPGGYYKAKFSLDINGITNAETAVAVGDLVAIYELTDARIEKCTVANLHLWPIDPGAGDTVGGNTEGAEAADTDNWTGNSTNGVDFYVMTRVAYFDAGDETLYGYIRKIEIDNKGHVYNISAETRVSIDVPVAC